MVDVVVIVLVVAALLGLVSLVLPIADRVGLPYTMLLAAVGVGLGSLAAAFGHYELFGIAGDMLRGLSDIGLSAEAFLYLFLPPLLFTAGLTVDVRLLFDEIGAVLLLAVVAVIVTTAVVGLALAPFTELGLTACLLLGAIVATTDPAAVISVFRDLGAPRRLTTLVAGESLFNDAAAIAIFTLLLRMLAGTRELDLWEAAGAFVVDFAGGLAAGYVLARLACALLSWLHSSTLAEITITVSLAYLTYILGDHYLQVSGVVAVVSAALTFAVHGRPRLRPGSWGPLVQTWHQLDFWANSLIFVLAAILAAQILPRASLSDCLLLIVLVVAALAARALVLYGMLPGLVALHLTQPVGLRTKAVILWGGLRGAVTMVLALSVNQNSFLSPETRYFIAVLAIGYVLFTLFVNAPTLRSLLRILGLDRLSPTESALRDRVMALSRATVRGQLAEVARDYGFDSALVARVAPPEPEAEPAEDGGESAGATVDMPLPSADRLRVGLLTLATRERELYLAHLNDGTISRRMVALRVAAADRIIDRVKTAGAAGYQESARQDIGLSRSYRLALWLHRQFGWTGPLARHIADRFESLLVSELIVRELERFNRRAVRPLLGQEIAGTLENLLSARLAIIADAVTAIELQFTSFAEALRSQYLARAGLRFEDAAYEHMFEESLITRELYNDLQRSLERRRVAVERQPPLDLGVGLKGMIRRVNVFSALNDASTELVARLLSPHMAMPDEQIVKKGEPGDAMYFIASGEVEVQLDKGGIKLGPGEFFGEMALLTRQPRTADVVALGYCHLLTLRSRDFQRLLRGNPEVKAQIEAIASERLAQNVAGVEG